MPITLPHKPTLEGLRHGGLAQAMRRQFTEFGSGWRGIFKMGPELTKLMHQAEAASIPAAVLEQIYKRASVHPLQTVLKGPPGRD